MRHPAPPPPEGQTFHDRIVLDIRKLHKSVWKMQDQIISAT
jgi:hypothetical protein